MNDFLTKPKLPTAIFSSNDILALATLQVANEKGIKVPESLYCWNGRYFLGRSKLSTFNNCPKKSQKNSRCAALTLIEKMKSNKDKATKMQLLSCSLLERGSMGPPSKTNKIDFVALNPIPIS